MYIFICDMFSLNFKPTTRLQILTHTWFDIHCSRSFVSSSSAFIQHQAGAFRHSFLLLLVFVCHSSSSHNLSHCSSHDLITCLQGAPHHQLVPVFVEDSSPPGYVPFLPSAVWAVFLLHICQWHCLPSISLSVISMTASSLNISCCPACLYALCVWIPFIVDGYKAEIVSPSGVCTQVQRPVTVTWMLKVSTGHNIVWS